MEILKTIAISILAVQLIGLVILYFSAKNSATIDYTKAPTLNHASLQVKDLQAELEFLNTLNIGFEVVWRPDNENVYLRLDNSVLALHKAKANASEVIDHIGITVDAQTLQKLAKEHNAEIQQHRDGCNGIYLTTPSGATIEFITKPTYLE